MCSAAFSQVQHSPTCDYKYCRCIQGVAAEGRVLGLLSCGDHIMQVFLTLCVGQRVTKRRRLSWLTDSALVYEPKLGGEGGVVGSQPMSTAVHRSPNKLGYLTPYLTYAWLAQDKSLERKGAFRKINSCRKVLFEVNFQTKRFCIAFYMSLILLRREVSVSGAKNRRYREATILPRHSQQGEAYRICRGEGIFWSLVTNENRIFPASLSAS